MIRNQQVRGSSLRTGTMETIACTFPRMDDRIPGARPEVRCGHGAARRRCGLLVALVALRLAAPRRRKGTAPDRLDTDSPPCRECESMVGGDWGAVYA